MAVADGLVLALDLALVLPLVGVIVRGLVAVFAFLYFGGFGRVPGCSQCISTMFHGHSPLVSILHFPK